MPFTLEETRVIMTQILRGLHYLHEEKEILHRDIKPRNIVLMDPDNDLSKLKIIDFGVACDSEASAEGYHVGTKIYQPPELFIKDLDEIIYDERGDVWAAGIIMFELLENKHPFHEKGMSDHQFVKNIIDYKRYGASILKEDSDHDQCALDLMQMLLQPSKSQRYRTKAALEHPFITNDQSKMIGLGHGS